MSKNLPTVAEHNLHLWDSAKQKCGGYLQKKASQTSAFSKGKWQKRYFCINLDLGPKENYQLEYYHAPDEKAPRAIMALVGATVKISSATAFAINFADSNSISLNADSSEIMQQWIATLENVISVANLRDRMISQYTSHDESGEEHDDHQEKDYTRGVNDLPKAFRTTGKDRGHYVKVSGKGWPTVRLDFDATSVPPASKERHKFIEMFCQDIAHAIGIDPNLVEVISIKNAPGMDWLSLVEFDVNLWINDHHNESDSVSQLSFENNHQKKKEARKKFLRLLYEMIGDTSSILYNGYITSKIDPSYAINFIDKGSTSQSSTLPISKTATSNSNGVSSHKELMIEEIFSENIEIMKIMQRYKEIVVPDDFVDHTHFTITLYFEGRIGIVSVPNPAVLIKRYCALWPFEVKNALGFIGTMQELWIDPIELIPRDSALKPTPIPFTSSVRLGGQLIINAVHLTPDSSYDVKCIDRRDEALNSLSTEEMEAIKETFQQCDLDGDGGISKFELEEIVRNRTQERKAAIEEKFQAYIRENDLSADDLDYTEGMKTQYLQQIQESQITLLKMFEAADLNGDGIISFTEFILAESWWLRCTINPDRVHLF